MATWHQLKAGPVELRGKTGYTVVTDPPNDCRSSMTGFPTRAEAQAYIDRCEGYRPGEARYSYILEPRRDR